jgi:hypothetical protein
MPRPTVNTNSEPLEARWLIDNIKALAEVHGFKYDRHNVDTYIIKEIVDRYNKEVERHVQAHPDSGPNTFKQAGYLTFWIRKLKPLRCSTLKYRYANEVLAYYAGLSLIDTRYPGDVEVARRVEGEEDKKKAVARFQEELCYSMRYRPMSPHALGLLFYAIWQLQAGHHQSN